VKTQQYLEGRGRKFMKKTPLKAEFPVALALPGKGEGQMMLVLRFGTASHLAT